MTTSFFVGLQNIVIGLLLIGCGIPLLLRKVKMNHLYGFRLKKSFISSENWYAINAYGGKILILWSIVLFLIGVATLFLPTNLLSSQLYPIVFGIAPLIICLALTIIQVVLYARKY